jgi:hypothetical protein
MQTIVAETTKPPAYPFINNRFKERETKLNRTTKLVWCTRPIRLEFLRGLPFEPQSNFPSAPVTTFVASVKGYLRMTA